MRRLYEQDEAVRPREESKREDLVQKLKKQAGMIKGTWFENKYDSYVNDLRNAKSAQEVQTAISNIAELVRLEGKVNILGQRYGDRSTVLGAVKSKRINCVSGNLILAKLIKRALRTAKIKADVKIVEVLATGKYWNGAGEGGHVITKVSFTKGRKRRDVYFDATNTVEMDDPLVITTKEENRVVGNDGTYYNLGFEYSLGEMEVFAHFQDRVRAGIKLKPKDLEEIPFGLHPYIVKNGNGLEILEKLYPEPDNMDVVEGEDRTKLELALYLAGSKSSNSLEWARYAGELIGFIDEEIRDLELAPVLDDIVSSYETIKIKGNEGDSIVLTNLWFATVYTLNFRPIDFGIVDVNIIRRAAHIVDDFQFSNPSTIPPPYKLQVLAAFRLMNYGESKGIRMPKKLQEIVDGFVDLTGFGKREFANAGNESIQYPIGTPKKVVEKLKRKQKFSAQLAILTSLMQGTEGIRITSL